MATWAAETLALALLAVCLAGAVVRPRGLNEAVFGIPAAIAIVCTGIVPFSAAVDTIRSLTSTVGFLAAILLFGHLCAEAGVFDYLGSVAAHASQGSSARLLVLFVVLASAVTAVLTLDATVVLLTPVVVRTARQMRVRPRPYSYSCIELANAGSLLLPVSNLTNLLAFSAAGLSFGHFAGLMALPWLAVTALEWLGLRLFFAADIDKERAPAVPTQAPPRYALAVLAATVIGFVVTSAVDVPPAWAAVAGVVLLATPALRARAMTVPRMIAEANLGFCAFVFALGVIVDGVARHGLTTGLAHLIPGGQSLPTLLALAFLAALLANVVNNLPATLALLPLVSAYPAAVLAVLIGVNIGPNATYVGSLATLLWRRILPDDLRPRARDFHLFGLLSVPVALVVTTVLLWGGVQVLGT